MRVGEAECDGQALHQCHKQKEVSLIAGSVWGTCRPPEFNERMFGAGGEGVWASLLLSDTAEREREREGGGGRERRSSEFWGGGRGWRVALREIVEIRRSPSPGRSGRTLHPATSRRRSADGDKLAETRPFKSHQRLGVQSRTAVCCGAASASSQQTADLDT